MKTIGLFSIIFSIIGVIIWFLFYSSISLPHVDPTPELVETQLRNMKELNAIILNLIIILISGIYIFLKNKN